jgi:hypothetical protein
MTDDQGRIQALCGHALSLIERRADWSELAGGSRLAHWTDRRFRATLVTPFTEVAGLVEIHVLDIWDEDARVLSVSWQDPHEIEIRSFLPGDWEAEFLALKAG